MAQHCFFVKSSQPNKHHSRSLDTALLQNLEFYTDLNKELDLYVAMFCLQSTGKDLVQSYLEFYYTYFSLIKNLKLENTGSSSIKDSSPVHLTFMRKNKFQGLSIPINRPIQINFTTPCPYFLVHYAKAVASFIIYIVFIFLRG